LAVRPLNYPESVQNPWGIIFAQQHEQTFTFKFICSELINAI